MTPDTIIQALSLPPQARLDHRVPKTLLIEHGSPTPADKRLIEAHIDHLHWVAALKPTTVGIASHRDTTREAVELSVLTLTLRDPERALTHARRSRLIELVHRAIPYHLLLISTLAGAPPSLSLADKRWAQNEARKVVLDGPVLHADSADHPPPIQAGLLAALSLTARPYATLYDLYRGWIDALQALHASRHLGAYNPPASAEHAARRAAALQTCEEVETMITRLRAAAARERQAPRQVEMNLELQRLRARLEAARQDL